MAVKRATKEPTIEAVETDSIVESVEVEETTEVSESPVTVEVPVETEDKSEDSNAVDVDVKKATVDNSNKPNGNVKIRMRVDHKCCIAMERYDLKAGKTYTVPENVKEILNKAGLLSPL